MEKIVRQALLYDFYGELLTEHQKKMYEDIVLNDLSYTEIARIEGISRQGVYDLVKRCDKILEDYEIKLHLVEKFTNTKEMVSEINQLVNGIKMENKDASLEDKIDRIENISKSILEEY